MKRQIIKTHSQRPYIATRIIVAIIVIGAVLYGIYEIASRAGLHFH